MIYLGELKPKFKLITSLTISENKAECNVELYCFGDKNPNVLAVAEAINSSCQDWKKVIVYTEGALEIGVLELLENNGAKVVTIEDVKDGLRI